MCRKLANHLGGIHHVAAGALALATVAPAMRLRMEDPDELFVNNPHADFTYDRSTGKGKAVQRAAS